MGRALRVFEQTAAGYSTDYTQDAFNLLARDGYRREPDGRIAGGPATLMRETSLAKLSDPAAIRDHLDRINRAIESDDPAQVVGSAKELIESTAKVVLQELNRAVNPSDNVPQLVSKAQRALGVHPTSIAAGPDGSGGIKKILGGATSDYDRLGGIAEPWLRHGSRPSWPPRRLRPRHAHLAIVGARLWCEFILDTLVDPNAPWRKSKQQPGT